MYIFPAGMNAGVWLSHPYSMSFFCHGEPRGAVAAAFSAIAMDQLTKNSADIAKTLVFDTAGITIKSYNRPPGGIPS